jgi:hypothetical protein
MKLKNEEYELLYKKLEYTFKKSGNPLVDKIKDKQDLSDDDIKLLLKKLEYTFRKSGNDIINQLSNMINLDGYSPVTYSNLKAKEKRDIREKEKEKLKHLKSFNEHNNEFND